MAKLERDFQPKFIQRLKKEFPGCRVLKNDEQYLPGIADWTLFVGPYYAILEIKREKPTKESDWRPNQQHYLKEFADRGAPSFCVYPENQEEVINALHQAFRTGR